MDTKKIGIKLSVAGRTYPMNINPDQEEGLRKAAKSINEMIFSFERNIEVKDKQDSLALVAITLASKVEQAKLDENNENLETKHKLEKLHQLIDTML